MHEILNTSLQFNGCIQMLQTLNQPLNWSEELNISCKWKVLFVLKIFFLLIILKFEILHNIVFSFSTSWITSNKSIIVFRSLQEFHYFKFLYSILLDIRYLSRICLIISLATISFVTMPVFFRQALIYSLWIIFDLCHHKF